MTEAQGSGQNGIVTPLGTLTIDFSAPKYHVQLRGKNELIARAAGLHLDIRNVLDVTAGLGEDAWTLARLGMQVTALEMHAGLYGLLAAAHARALEDPKLRPIAERLKFIHAEAGEYLDGLSRLRIARPETIYLDPMFEVSKKTAKPKKDMQILRSLETVATPVEVLLEKARALCTRRVVLKRAAKDPLVQEPVTAQYKGKSVRFDVYGPRSTAT